MLSVAHGARLPLWFPDGKRPLATLTHVDSVVQCVAHGLRRMLISVLRYVAHGLRSWTRGGITRNIVTEPLGQATLPEQGETRMHTPCGTFVLLLYSISRYLVVVRACLLSQHFGNDRCSLRRCARDRDFTVKWSNGFTFYFTCKIYVKCRFYILVIILHFTRSFTVKQM
jgi:hypothetical protein